MSSGIKRHRRISPMPLTSSFPQIADEPWNKNEHNYTLTPEQLQEVFAKFGEPKMKLKDRPRSHYMSGGKKK